MPLVIELPIGSFDAGKVEALHDDVRFIYRLFDRVRAERGLPDVNIGVVLASPFEATVRTRMKGIADDDPLFAATRDTGIVAAKNLPQSSDCSDVLVLLNGEFWKANIDDGPPSRVRQLHLIAHELTHPYLSRIRHASGCLEGVEVPSFTAGEIAASLTRILVDEYRADRMAEIVVRMLCSVDDSAGVKQPVGYWELFGSSEVDDAHRVLAAAHPAWPDVVQEYREWRIELTDMWRRVVQSIEGALVRMMHAQAAADSADGPDLVTLTEFAELPAVRLYISGDWASFIGALRSSPLLPEARDAREQEEALVIIGSGYLHGIWNSLGLHPFEHGGREWGLNVDAPAR